MDRQTFDQMLTHVDTSAWGRDGAKETEDLWQEVQQGEAVVYLNDDGLLTRTVYGVGAVLWRPDEPGRTHLFLQETVQTFTNGSSRYRDLEISIAEKCLADEQAAVALPRAFAEELGLTVQLQLQEPMRQRTELYSDSYPGTIRQYHTDIWHMLLPDSLYQQEYCEVQAKKTNWWHWRRLPLGCSPPPFNATVSPAE